MTSRLQSFTFRNLLNLFNKMLNYNVCTKYRCTIKRYGYMLDLSIYEKRPNFHESSASDARYERFCVKNSIVRLYRVHRRRHTRARIESTGRHFIHAYIGERIPLVRLRNFRRFRCRAWRNSKANVSDIREQREGNIPMVDGGAVG